MFRRCSALLRYHQETFNPRAEAFLVQIMRGLKCEKRWEIGMGHSINAREAYPATGELIMFDLPFLSPDMDRLPHTIRELLEGFNARDKVQEVLNRTAADVSMESQTDSETVRDYLLHHSIDIDISFMALIGCYGAAYCRGRPINDVTPMAYLSYIDDYYSESPMHQRIMEIAYENILDVTKLSPMIWRLDEFWISLFKYKSNVFRGELFPVAPTLINHSCWPNAEFQEDGALVTLRPIEANEQITVSLYGKDCKEVEEKGLAGKTFKCFTPGCEFSKRVPLPEPPTPVKKKEDMEYVTPWHEAFIDMPDVRHTARDDRWRTPARTKMQKMWKEEVTRAGRDLNNTPQLPGSRPKRHLLNKQPDADGNYLSQGRNMGPQLQLTGGSSGSSAL